MIAVFFLALSVAVDACAAAMCCGLETPGFQFRDGLRLACWFGAFQTGMSLIGGLAGGELNEHVRMLGAVTLLLTLLSALLGRQGGQRFHRGASACGGAVLMLIGTRILVEALV